MTGLGAATEASALAAAARIIDDFGNHRRDAYFAGFSPDATFLFHNVDHRLESRAAYERLWAEWEDQGFRVHRCLSQNRRVQLFGDMAVFSHDVETEAELGGVTAVTHERETIVLVQTAGLWLGVHEHLSVMD
ncbi:nuclear transport factor 2 family protein [Lacisediminihabitans profunda]|uniref:Nuclear transport factor 2 family protein n=1 Tax=Lacisediminihabitans profunda TaxID=2594790 RepID=A0A5C8UTE3_9MICO|nr:nuclear transport factor 2 family protein [Lacisediminihabitans profunda]TXN31883.1 nuclear transport factor 2 family protein [Lacisediminihabitans profunda]